MKRSLKRSESSYQMPLSFLDLLLNSLLILIFVFFLAPISKKEKEEFKSPEELIDRFRIKATWDDEKDADVDLYVADPSGELVFYKRREQGLMHLDRDDLGHSNDTTRKPDGSVIKLNHNEENVTLRGIVPGEYTVNVHMYNIRDARSVTVRVRIFDLKGSDHSVKEKSVSLERNGEEKTVFRFTLDADGKISRINSLPRKLATSQYDAQSGYQHHEEQ
jgi:hypothetical protein